MKKIVSILFLVGFSLNLQSCGMAKKSVIRDAENAPFFQHCESETLTTEQKHTLKTLFKHFRVRSCDDLYAELTGFEYQHVEKSGIKDYTIFKYVPGLKRLGLDGNEISDLTAFEAFDNLEMLSIRRNQATDLRPLLKMKSLKVVQVYGNPVEKESEKCPTNSDMNQINEFCFDEQKFTHDFENTEENRKVATADIRDILSRVIEHKRLEEYLHAHSIPKRSSLKIFVDKDVPADRMNLVKFGKAITFTEKADNQNLNINLTVKSPLTVAKFTYPPEGIFGSFKLKKTDGSLRVMHSTILE